MKTLTSNKAFWLLLVICVVTILPFLGLSEYHTKGEPREAIVSYSMLDSRCNRITGTKLHISERAETMGVRGVERGREERGISYSSGLGSINGYG